MSNSFAEVYGWGDCPKTKNTFFKVEDSIQEIMQRKIDVVPENNLKGQSDLKVENDDQQKLVFGQSVGGALPEKG